MVRSALLVCLTLLFGASLIHAREIGAQDIARLQSGVVKITAKPSSGTTKSGTGFIVRLESNAAYIVTAAHVVAGDPNPKVEFFTKQHVQFPAEALPGAEGGDDVGGLALLLVKGKENLPSGIGALPLASTSLRLEDMVMIGFPLGAGPWHVTKGNIGSRQGRTIYFDPRVDSGNSGGPIIQRGKVVGVVMAARSSGQGITVRGVQDYIEGFGITAQESTSAASMATESSSPPAVMAKPEPRQTTQDHEITSKDGATTSGSGKSGRTIRMMEKVGEGDSSLQIVYYKSNRVDLQQVQIDSVRAATFDLRTVLEQSQVGRNALESMKQYAAVRQQAIVSDDEDLKQLKNKVKDGNRSLAQEYSQKLRLHKAKLEEFSAEIKEKQKDMVDLYTARIENAARRVAEEDGWDLVLDNLGHLSEENKGLLPLYFRDFLRSAPEITKAVIVKFDDLYR